MLLIYSPCVIACLIIQRPALTTQFDLAHLFALIHFSKRVFEVLFVHIYKSKTDLETAISISSTYTITTVLDLLVVRGIPNYVYSDTVTRCGIFLFIVGELINLYHHVLLRNMRTKGQNAKGYSLPKGGLFNFVLAPHYFSEQITFLGLILVSQNIVSVTLRLFPFIYLSSRAAETRAWYNLNLEDAQDKAELVKRKNLIPFIW
ncbi:3-oxo-5-alpha-steroid 4-dehydrogenase-domain-containing protein [Pilaira anomala]|nr:3-oxo-5-alpha-steroid 4-dehydrogenase-domain-containing protein [Pilaira anomala]